MPARLACAAADGFHRADVAAGQHRVAAFGQQSAELQGLGIGAFAFSGLGSAKNSIFIKVLTAMR